jgi:hypothetical protein
MYIIYGGKPSVTLSHDGIFLGSLNPEKKGNTFLLNSFNFKPATPRLIPENSILL